MEDQWLGSNQDTPTSQGLHNAGHNTELMFQTQAGITASVMPRSGPKWENPLNFEIFFMPPFRAEEFFQVHQTLCPAMTFL